MTYDELRKMEMASLPTVGSCSMFGTANTMSALAEVLGLTLPLWYLPGCRVGKTAPCPCQRQTHRKDG